MSDRERQKVDELLKTYPNLKGFYWAKEHLRDAYRAKDKEEAAKLLDLIIMDLKASDDAQAYRWGNTLKKWREPILNYSDNRTTNAFTEGCNTKIKMLKRLSFGLRDVTVHLRRYCWDSYHRNVSTTSGSLIREPQSLCVGIDETADVRYFN